MSHISELLPQNFDEYKAIIVKSILNSPIATDTFKIGDQVRIHDSETNEIWKIHKFITHPSQKIMAILIQEDAPDTSCLPTSTASTFLEQLILV